LFSSGLHQHETREKEGKKEEGGKTRTGTDKNRGRSAAVKAAGAAKHLRCP